MEDFAHGTASMRPVRSLARTNASLLGRAKEDLSRPFVPYTRKSSFNGPRSSAAFQALPTLRIASPSPPSGARAPFRAEDPQPGDAQLPLRRPLAASQLASPGAYRKARR